MSIVLADFSPKTIGKQILAPTTKNGTRRYTGVTLIVNPLDYAEKFFAIGAKQKDDGTWTFNNFAVPGLSIIQSFAVPLNKMIAGKPKNYFMGVGVSAKLETTDILRMIEDQRLYLTWRLAKEQGYVTIIKDETNKPEHIAKWFAEQARHYKIKLITADM